MAGMRVRPTLGVGGVMEVVSEEGGGGGWRTADHASQQKNEKRKARQRGKEEGDKVHSSSPGTR